MNTTHNAQAAVSQLFTVEESALLTLFPQETRAGSIAALSRFLPTKDQLEDDMTVLVLQTIYKLQHMTDAGFASAYRLYDGKRG